MHDLDTNGDKIQDKYTNDEISKDYLNKYLIKDFEDTFAKSRFEYQMFLVPFSSRYAMWTRVSLNVPLLREFVASYMWVVLTKPHT